MPTTKPELPAGYPNDLPPAELRVLTKESYRDAFRLKVAKHQDDFVADNVWSVAEAYFHEEARPFGIYCGELIVGFVMLSVEELEKGTVWVWRMMIGIDHQRKGFGRQAIDAVLAYARSVEGATELKLSHTPDKDGNPGPFYASLGFEYTGEIEHGERVMRRDLAPLK